MKERFPPELAGMRDFACIPPKGRRLTEYEAVTVYAQPTFGSGGKQVCGDHKRRADGRPLFDPTATRVRCDDWFGYRDPSQLWQKPYYVMQSDAEKAIERATEVAIRSGAAAGMDGTWASAGLEGTYLPFAHVEFGLFRTLNLAARETMSDTVNNVLLFFAADKLRHAQDICILGLDLEPAVTGIDGRAGKAAWTGAPAWQPLRSVVEELLACRDWMETATAVALAFEPLLGEPFREILFSRVAARGGDMITPVISLHAQADWSRSAAAMQELFRFVGSEPTWGSDNLDLIRAWGQSWRAKVEPVARDLLLDREAALGASGIAAEAGAVARRLTAEMDDVVGAAVTV